jgi:hypothetical protein
MTRHIRFFAVSFLLCVVPAYGAKINPTIMVDTTSIRGSGFTPGREVVIFGAANIPQQFYARLVDYLQVVTVDGAGAFRWTPSEAISIHSMTPGTVVVLNPLCGNEVMPSGFAYDTSVAGVVSAQPGLILGERSSTKEMIATTGRVRVRVDARAQPVKVGDLLVTSDVPGTAMRSEPIDIAGIKLHRPGTLIGKALEPLASGTAEIMVLLSLQ